MRLISGRRSLWFVLVALVALVAVCPASAHAQNRWDRYQPGTLAELIKSKTRFVDSVATPQMRFLTVAQTFPTRASLEFGGRTRPIDADRARLLRLWAQSVKVDTAQVAVYQEEWLFRENRVDHWLPMQASVAASLRSQVKKGDTLTVYFQWFGTIRQDGFKDWVTPAMRVHRRD